MSEQPIEARTAATLLQERVELRVGEKSFTMAPPTLATLVAVSREIARLPLPDLNPDAPVVEQALAIAADCLPVARIAAMLILGVHQQPQEAPGFPARSARNPEKRHRAEGGSPKSESPVGSNPPALFSRLFRRRRPDPEPDLDALARTLACELTLSQLHDLVAKALAQMQIADFFGLTTFLTTVNMTRRKVVTAPTASGERSPR